jgi:hypothetical protein
MHVENGNELPSSTSGPERTESIKNNQMHATALSFPEKVSGVYCIVVRSCTTRDMHTPEV